MESRIARGWVVSLFLLSLPLSAQERNPDQRLDEIEKQIGALRNVVELLRKPEEARGATTAPATQAASAPAEDPIARIREEGMNRSQVMQTLSYLTDVIGPRLTGSPNLKRANEWTRERLSSWGLANAHLEPWGPFGRGWSLRRFSIQVIEPQAIPLIGAPKAWSPGFDKPVSGEVVYIDARTEGELEQKYKGKLKGAIILYGPPREVQARFEAPAVRIADPNLLEMANSDGSGGRSPVGLARSQSASERRSAFADARLAGMRRGGGGGGGVGNTGATTGPTTQPATLGSTGPASRPNRLLTSSRLLAFALKERAAAVVNPSNQGDGGTFFVSSASVPDSDGDRGVSRPSTSPTSRPGERERGPSPWSVEKHPMPAQVCLATEDYNRLVRMIRQGEKLKIELDLRVQYHDDDPMAYNTIAEIPGSDPRLADEIVMIGAHMDSWHSGTGATDNAAGCAAAMEAVRIIRALGLKPRRTIRIGLWTGEEQGLLGSRAYVTKHLGAYQEEPAPSTRATTGPTVRPSSRSSTSRPSRRLVKQPAYDKFSVYFNLDNGTGKIRGVYMQNNEAVRPIFRSWLAPFADLGAQTLTLNRTGGTDHLSFDSIGLPGFQFIQDPVEYWSRTHHSNADVYDRAQGEDLKQASTIMAAFLYNAAMADEKLPRKETGAAERPRNVAQTDGTSAAPDAAPISVPPPPEPVPPAKSASANPPARATGSADSSPDPRK